MEQRKNLRFITLLPERHTAEPTVPFCRKGTFRGHVALPRCWLLRSHQATGEVFVKQTPADLQSCMAKGTKRDHTCAGRLSLHPPQHSPYASFHPFAYIWLLASNDLTHSLQKFSLFYLQEQRSGMSFLTQTCAMFFLLIVTGKLEQAFSEVCHLSHESLEMLLVNQSDLGI